MQTLKIPNQIRTKTNQTKESEAETTALDNQTSSVDPGVEERHKNRGNRNGGTYCGMEKGGTCSLIDQLNLIRTFFG